MIKVYGGTTKCESSLCLSCRNATVVHGQTGVLIECSVLYRENGRIVAAMQPVVACSEYDDKARPSLSNMREIAWELTPNKKTGKLGFVSPDVKKIKTLTDPTTGREVW